jgi:tetratricopeptide (TPR) repeat protein
MQRTGAVALLLIPAVLLAGDETLPPPRPAPAPTPSNLPVPPPLPPRMINLPPVPETPTSAPDLEVLRQESERLRAESEALAAERQKALTGAPTDSDEVAHLRRRLAELVATLAARPLARRMTPVDNAPDPARNTVSTHAEGHNPASGSSAEAPPGDPVLAARALFRAGDHAAALETYRQIDLDGLTRDERTLVQYMSACCLRKLGRLDEAAAIYREVADAREDEVLTDCALWHLSAINWRRDMEKQLETLRERRQAH